MQTFTYSSKKIVLLSLAIIVSLASCMNPGKEIKFHTNKVYYKDGATEQDGQKLGDYLVKTKYFDTTTEKERDIQVLKEGDTYKVNFVVDTVAFKQQPDAYNLFKSLESELSQNVFSGGKVNVGVVGPDLKEVKH